MGLTTVLISILIEQVDIIGARSKDAVGSKFGRDKFINSHHRRRPAGTVETTVEPVFGAIRGFRVSVGVATNTRHQQQVSKFYYKGSEDALTRLTRQ